MSRGQDLIFGVGDEPYDEFLFDEIATERPMADAAMNDTTDDVSTSLSDLSDSQEIILAVLQVCSSILSLIGSCMIVFKILRSLSRKQTTTPYDRIILGLSTCDIVSSCTYMVGPFLLPSETSQRIFALGNDRTCNQLGFLTQLSGLWAVWYNCILSFYYLLTVRFSVKRKEFRRKYELWFHLSGAIFFPTTAITGYFGDWYGEQALSMACWVDTFPTKCDESGENCTGDYSELVAYIFGAMPTAITFLAVIINNVIIYLYVRKSLRSPVTSTDIESDGASKESEDSSERQKLVNERLRKEVAVQGFLYVSTFLLTILPTLIIQILDGSLGYEEEDQGSVYPLLVFNSILLPFQGFFNVFIYIRPTYCRFREADPEESRLATLRRTLFDPKIPRFTETIGVTTSAGNSRHSRKKRSRKKKQSGGSDGSKKLGGSNFSVSLDNIIEEEEGNEHDSVGKDDIVAESVSTENLSATGATGRTS